MYGDLISNVVAIAYHDGNCLTRMRMAGFSVKLRYTLRVYPWNLPKRWTGLKRTRLRAPWSRSQFLLRARSLASFALLLKQQMTISASNGNPSMHDTIGMIILSGVTKRKKIQNSFNALVVRFVWWTSGHESSRTNPVGSSYQSETFQAPLACHLSLREFHLLNTSSKSRIRDAISHFISSRSFRVE